MANSLVVIVASARNLRCAHLIPMRVTGLALVIAVGCGAGCARRVPVAPKESIVGRWLVNAPDSKTIVAGTVTLDFRADGSLTQEENLSGAIMTLHSTYTLSGSVLTEVLKSVTVTDGQSMKGTGQTESFVYFLRHNTLTLTKPSASVKIVLTRIS